MTDEEVCKVDIGEACKRGVALYHRIEAATTVAGGFEAWEIVDNLLDDMQDVIDEIDEAVHEMLDELGEEDD